MSLDTRVLSLDPADASDAVSRRITAQIYDTLLDWAPDDRTADVRALRPEILATLPTVSDDGLTWTLQLRADADARRFAATTCLGGQARPVRPSDVAASLLRIDPARHAAYALLAGRFLGLDAYHTGHTERASPIDHAEHPAPPPGIVADDAAHTVTLRLTRPQPQLLAILASPMLAVLPRECIAYHDGRDAEHPPLARHPVGSGPYVLDLTHSELPRSVVLNPSPETTAAPRPGCRHGPIASTHFSDPEPALRAFQSGELAAIVPGQSQFAEVVADATTSRLRAVPAGTTLLRFPVLATTLLVFRMGDPDLGASRDPTTDAEHRALRQAIALAFDAVRYQRIVRNDAWARPRARIVPRGLGGADDDTPLHRFAPPAADVQQARQILAAAGLHGPRTLRYWTGISEAEQQEAIILRDALRPLDIDLQITRRDGFHGDIFQGRSDAQLFALRFDADYLDAQNFLAPFTCGAPDNFSQYCDPAYDAAYTAYELLQPGPARDQAAAALERLLGEAVPVRPIDQPESWYLAQPWLTGVSRHPIAGLRIDLLCAHE